MNSYIKKTICLMVLLSSGYMFSADNGDNNNAHDNPRPSATASPSSNSSTSAYLIVIPQSMHRAQDANRAAAEALIACGKIRLNIDQVVEIMDNARTVGKQYVEDIYAGRVKPGQNLPAFFEWTSKGPNFKMELAMAAAEAKLGQQAPK